MGEIVHTSRIQIMREGGPVRRATIEGFPGEIRYGVHGGIKDFYGYKLKPEEEHPATLDYVISAIGG